MMLASDLVRVRNLALHLARSEALDEQRRVAAAAAARGEGSKKVQKRLPRCTCFQVA